MSSLISGFIRNYVSHPIRFLMEFIILVVIRYHGEVSLINTVDTHQRDGAQ